MQDINGTYKFIIQVSVILIMYQLFNLINHICKGIYKYFIMKPMNIFERYGGKGMWVVITGASSGQGKDLSLAYAHIGFNLLLIGSKRTLNTMSEIKAKYPLVDVVIIYKDFRKAFETDFFDDIKKEFTRLSTKIAILVNNVGHRIGWKPYHEMKPEFIRDVIATGTIVQSRLTHMIIPIFLERKKQAVLRASTMTSALINITAQCMHPNFLLGITMSNEISVPYLSVYEASNAFGFYQSNSIYKEYKDDFDILTITPGAVITENTIFLNKTIFCINSTNFVQNILKMMGNVQGVTCAYWGHAISNYLINILPSYKDVILNKVGTIISNDCMKKLNINNGNSDDYIDKYSL